MSNALHLYQMEKDKAVSRTIQVNSARQAASDTKELFNLGTSTYLEVLSAEQSYLSAQLAEVSDTFSSMQQSSVCIKRLEEEENKMSDK